MRNTKRIWLAAAIVTAGFLSACGSDSDPDECPDVNANGICDTDEPGHGQCDVMDRDAQGKCPDAAPDCTGTQILVDDACEDCPPGEIAQENVCVMPSVVCDANEIVVEDECVACGDDATATNNQCVPHCEDTQILVSNVCVDCAAGQVNDGNDVCISEGTDDCDAGEILVDDVCCVDANDNDLCDDDEPGDGICPLEERDANGDCPTVCHSDLENDDGICTCADLDEDGLCDSDPADDCFGIENGDDVDEDGFCSDTDCDDNDAHTYPGAVEICGQPVVNDCDNSCYDTVCDAGDLAAAKDGLIGEAIYGTPTQWSDVTDDVDGAGKVYETDGNVGLHFCGAGPFHVDLRTSGTDSRLQLHSGLAQGATPTLTAAEEDRPVVDVRDAGYVTVNGLSLQHKQGFAGNEGHGLRCEQAEFMIQNASVSNNAAKLGGGIYSEGCQFVVEGTVGLDSNKAEEGSAFFITGGSKSKSKGASLRFSANTTGSSDSAALHVEKESVIEWDLGPDSPIADFRGNYDAQNQSRDIRVSTDAELGITIANFTSPGEHHVRTDDSTHEYGVGVELLCNSSLCTP